MRYARVADGEQRLLAHERGDERRVGRVRPVVARQLVRRLRVARVAERQEALGEYLYNNRNYRLIS